MNEVKSFFFFLTFWLHCEACGILASQQVLSLCPLQWKCRVLTVGLPVKSQTKILVSKITRFLRLSLKADLLVLHYLDYLDPRKERVEFLVLLHSFFWPCS